MDRCQHLACRVCQDASGIGPGLCSNGGSTILFIFQLIGNRDLPTRATLVPTKVNDILVQKYELGRDICEKRHRMDGSAPAVVITDPGMRPQIVAKF